MKKKFDINLVDHKKSENKSRYENSLLMLRGVGWDTSFIESTIADSLDNIDNNIKSFVIYGEPQCGKTGMMISLTAAILDKGFKIVIVVMKDDVQLLDQNLKRFRNSDIDPSPKNYAEILTKDDDINIGEWIIFCKKNKGDLEQLISKLHGVGNRVVIDDEADYATPNSKVNKGKKTTINELVEKLVGKGGVYIGVTATPARLDLNNTLDNANDKWIEFLPHKEYVGQDIFFPVTISDGLKYKLTTLPDSGDIPKYLRQALFSYLINVAHLNTTTKKENKFSMLVHTSGITDDHVKDLKTVKQVFSALKNSKNSKHKKYLENIFDITEDRYSGEGYEIIRYIIENISKNVIVVMNASTDKKNIDFSAATKPAAIFTIAIGGNIVSRGVTFENLITMFFTRDVKNKIQQDTYVQRARMFGDRNPYLEYFELIIPEELYLKWHRCFILHRLALQSIKAGNTPVWLEDSGTNAAARASIDKSLVAIDKGEIGYEVFNYDKKVEEIIERVDISAVEKLKLLNDKLGDDCLPSFLIKFIGNYSYGKSGVIAVHPSASVSGRKDVDQTTITRPKGFIGQFEREVAKYPNALHHFKIFYNDKDNARVYYRYSAGSISFLKRLTHNKND